MGRRLGAITAAVSQQPQAAAARPELTYTKQTQLSLCGAAPAGTSHGDTGVPGAQDPRRARHFSLLQHPPSYSDDAGPSQGTPCTTNPDPSQGPRRLFQVLSVSVPPGIEADPSKLAHHLSYSPSPSPLCAHTQVDTAHACIHTCRHVFTHTHTPTRVHTHACVRTHPCSCSCRNTEKA